MNYTKSFFQDVLNIKWYWWRVEYQHRGTPHVHGFIKLSNDHDLEKLGKTALRGYLQSKSSKEHDYLSESQQMIFQGQEAEQKIIKFAENFINLRNYHKQNDKTQNMDYVVGEHPCKRPFHLVKKKDYEMDYYDLINSVQRHTKCFFHSCMSPIH